MHQAHFTTLAAVETTQEFRIKAAESRYIIFFISSSLLGHEGKFQKILYIFLQYGFSAQCFIAFKKIYFKIKKQQKPTSLLFFLLFQQYCVRSYFCTKILCGIRMSSPSLPYCGTINPFGSYRLVPEL